MRARFNNGLLTAAAVTSLLCACNNGSAITAVPAGNPQAARALVKHLSSSGGSNVIQHVVIIIQENRSMDNLFYGYPNADTQPYGYNEEGDKIPLKPVGLQAQWDLSHDSYSATTACDGPKSDLPGTHCKMNGFDNEYYQCGKGSPYPACPNANPPYSYVPHSQTKPYFAMAQQYVLADRMFQSDWDMSSFVSHQYIIAAQADDTINFPTGQWGCEGGSGDTIDTMNSERGINPSSDAIPPCFNYTTLATELDAAKLSWRFYASVINQSGGLWSAYQAVDPIFYGPDWDKDVISPQTRFFNDLKKGELANVTWITPTCATSDHSGYTCGVNPPQGPSWVASLVNAIGESKFWTSTAIFIFWDDPGGWYDHVPPPYVNIDGLGMRVPLLVISAYAKQNYVSHIQYQNTSILKFIEDRFDLAALTKSDKHAISPEVDCFDFSQPARKFAPIPAEYDENFFMHQRPDPRPPDTE